MYPLKRLRLGVWESQLHIDNQLFVMVQSDKFIFVAVHPTREIASPNLNPKFFIENFELSNISWQKNKKQILKLFGSRNPFTTKVVDSSKEKSKVDFFGVITFELSFKDVGGFE